MDQTTDAAEVEQIPLAEIDVSNASLYQNDTWRPYFARLRREAPVHYLEDSVNGAFWSVTSHPLIKQVDTNHEVFSSGVGGISIVDGPPAGTPEDETQEIENFISMDPPRHDEQRNTVQPAVAPRNLPTSNRSSANASSTFSRICRWARPSTG